MSKSFEYFLIMDEDDFVSLPSTVRSLFKYKEVRETNEYDENKDDEVYKELYKRKKKASDELQEYLFRKRHK